MPEVRVRRSERPGRTESPVGLVIAPITAKAATYAVTHWHYSHRMPVGRRIMHGVWEDGEFIGALILSRGSNNHLGSPYGLTQTEVCELTRIALREHRTPVSQIVSQCLAWLRTGSPGLRMVVSFADPGQGHHGGIYQAGNWIYTGVAEPSRFFRINGRLVHERSLSVSLGFTARPGQHRTLPRNVKWLRENLDPHAEEVMVQGKHRYLYPLDRAMRRKVTPLARPYPAAEVSTATRPASGEERQVQALPAAPNGVVS